jgi:hypothetical protein
MVIRAPHPSISEPKTYLTAASAVSATSLTVANNGSFSTNDYTVIGFPGQEGAELHKISSVSGTTTINYAADALNFAQSTNTPVTYIKYNQVKFYLGDYSARYSTGTISVSKDSAVVTGSGTSWGSITTNYSLLLNGKWYDIASVDSTTQITLTENYTSESVTSSTYALIPFSSQATVSITVDQPFTSWDDTDAISEDFYRTEYYNSTSTLASSRSSIISAAQNDGVSEFSLQAIEDEVLSEMRDMEEVRRTRAEIDRDVNNALRDLFNVVISKVQENYLNSYTTMNFSANRSEYPLPDDFRKLTAVWVSYDGSSYKKAEHMDIAQDDPNASYNQSWPYYYLRDNVIGFRPSPTAAATTAVKMWYERRVPSLKYAGDEVPHILRDYKRLLVDYALEKANLAEDDTKANLYRASYENGKSMMAKSIKTRDLSHNRRVEIVNDTDLYY